METHKVEKSKKERNFKTLISLDRGTIRMNSNRICRLSKP